MYINEAAVSEAYLFFFIRYANDKTLLIQCDSTGVLLKGEFLFFSYTELEQYLCEYISLKFEVIKVQKL